MAVGLGLLFNLRLPINFAAPFRAASIIDLWRRWHITLSRFLRDFVYVPLGGSNCGPLRRSGNLIMTMVLGGLWHGANWTFIAWGAFNGVLLVLNHAWRSYRGARVPTPPAAARRLGRHLHGLRDRHDDVPLGRYRRALPHAAGHAGAAPTGRRRRITSGSRTDLYAIRHGYLPEALVRAWFGVNWSVIATISTLAALAIALLLPDTMELVDYREGEPHSDWRRPAGALALAAFAGLARLRRRRVRSAFTFFWEFNEFLYYQF